MPRFANRVVNELTFFQWINIEYGLVKRQYKELEEDQKQRLKRKYKTQLTKNANLYYREKE